jgi:hypothetical protein
MYIALELMMQLEESPPVPSKGAGSRVTGLTGHESESFLTHEQRARKPLFDAVRRSYDIQV